MMTSLKTTVCIAALCAGTGATADVTAAQVWEDWKTDLTKSGQTSITTTGEDIGEGVVTVSGLTVSTTDEGNGISGNFGTIIFTEQGDGTVKVQMDDNIIIESSDADDASVTFEVRQTGLDIIVSGDENAMSYDVTADSYTIDVLDIIEDGQPALDGDIMVTLNGFDGTFGTMTTDFKNITYDLNIGSIDLLVDFVEPQQKDTVLLSGKVEAVAVNSEVVLPLGVDNPDDMIMNGLTIGVNSGYEKANFIFNMNSAGTTSVGSVGLSNGSTVFALSQDELTYNVSTNSLSIKVENSDLPIPVEIALAEIGTGLVMPLSVTETPEDFALSLTLTDLVVNDGIWDMGDPTGTFARDPISVDLNLDGKTILYYDMMDPAQEAAREQADAPGELHALNLNSLLVSAAGAVLTGSGAFTFDNSGPRLMDEIPMPLGDATFELTGGNMLIDNLVAMGLVQEADASAGRMMMGMFARSIGDDQLRTTVEVNDQGHVIVNGQRMQ